MAQPLPKFDETSSGIDESVLRLEQAFQRLEQAVGYTRTGHNSLRADREKLNLLLQDADGEIGRLKQAVHTVSRRLDETIATLEKEG